MSAPPDPYPYPSHAPPPPPSSGAPPPPPPSYSVGPSPPQPSAPLPPSSAPPPSAPPPSGPPFAAPPGSYQSHNPPQPPPPAGYYGQEYPPPPPSQPYGAAPPPPGAYGSYQTQPQPQPQPHGAYGVTASPYDPQFQHQGQAPTKRPVSCLMITMLIFGIISLIFTATATGTEWSHFEFEIVFKNDNCVQSFYLKNVKQHGDGCLETWTKSYDDYLDTWTGSCRDNIAQKFKDAAQMAKGSMFTAYLFVLAQIVLSIVTMATGMRLYRLGLVQIIVYAVGVALIPLAANGWSGEAPESGDISDCDAFIRSWTYYKAYVGPILLWMSAGISFMCAFFALCNFRSAKRFYQYSAI